MVIHGYTCLYMVIHGFTSLTTHTSHRSMGRSTFSDFVPKSRHFWGENPGEFGLGQPRGDLRAGAKR